MTEFLRHRIKAVDIDGRRLLDAIPNGDHVDLIYAEPGRIPLGVRVGGGAVETLDASAGVVLGGTEITPEPTNLEVFSGANVLLGQWHGEDEERVRDWLWFHAEHHGATAAVILDRTPDDQKLHLQGVDPRIKVVLSLEPETPLGRVGYPPETHLLCAPDAPGKARLSTPMPDPWCAPLGVRVVFELIRRRFLARAHAVAHIDVIDLLDPCHGSVFDCAALAGSGAVWLFGRHVYPWRMPVDKSVRFSDHMCVLFDSASRRRRWCVSPQRTGDHLLWDLTKLHRLQSAPIGPCEFFRHLGLRYRFEPISKLAPRTALIEHPPLRKLAHDIWRETQIQMPVLAKLRDLPSERRVIVTCMKNEGPFILEWVAHHRAIGFDDILVYSNDCTDGTDQLLDKLDELGLVHHRKNPFRELGLKPQHAALQAAANESVVQNAGWIISMDVDEFVNIKVGDGSLDALFSEIPAANLISLTWKLFGNCDIHEFSSEYVTHQFTRAAPEMCRKPHQAWGFKTLFQNRALFKKLGVHRPKGLQPSLWEEINWVNGSGRKIPRSMYRNAWRSTTGTVGYDLVQLNHYAVRSAESFLVKRDRGRVNHTDRDQGLSYWFRMNNNATEDTSIFSQLPRLEAAVTNLLMNSEVAELHVQCIVRHRERIAQLRATLEYSEFYEELTSKRFERLSRMHAHFGASVFQAGPNAVPDSVLENAGDPTFFLSAPRQEPVS